MAICKQIYGIVCVYLCFIAGGSGYYISSTNKTWQTAGTYCDLAQPTYRYNGSGVLELVEHINIDEPIPEPGVRIGYFKAFTEFEFKGCGMNLFSNGTPTEVYSLVQCHHKCGGANIGLIGATKMTCVCIKTLDNNRINSLCIPCGDFICGNGSIKALYSVFPDTTSEVGTNAIDYVCKVSTSYSNASAWVNCSDTNTSNTRDVWCKTNDSATPFVSGKRFSAWNTANDYCANNRSFPASAVGYTGRPFPNMTFTNIRREWTLHPGNGSSSKGPKQFAYIIPRSKQIFFSNEATAATKKILCSVNEPTTTVTTPSTTPRSSSTSTTTLYLNTSASTTKSPSTQEAGKTASLFDTTTPSKQPTTVVSPMTEATPTSGQSDASSKKSSQGSSTIGIASGVTVAVVLVAAVGVVIVLRNKGKWCFAITKCSKLENTDDNHHISLDKVESNTYENTRGCTKDIDEYYADIDNDSANTESKQTGFYETPGAPVINHAYGTRMKRERGASKDTDVTYQNTNGKLPESEAHTYFVLEKQGIEHQRNAVNPIPTNMHDYFVLEKQQSAVANENSVSANERVMGNGDMYQEIHASYENTGIDDLRGDNNDNDYTNKAFKDSNTDFSDNVYNHLNSGGDEYDHVSKGRNIVMAVENDYADTTGVVRK